MTAYTLSSKFSPLSPAEAALAAYDAAKEFTANQRIRACMGGRWYTGLITSLLYGVSSDGRLGVLGPDVHVVKLDQPDDHCVSYHALDKRNIEPV